jgi:AraC-like DNA-binding protein
MSVTVPPTQWDAVARERITADPVCVSSRGARGLASKLMRHVANEMPKEALVGESLCTELLGLATATSSTERRRPRWLDRAIEALTADFARDVSLAEIARTVGVHPCHMTRSFRAFERCTPANISREPGCTARPGCSPKRGSRSRRSLSLRASPTRVTSASASAAATVLRLANIVAAQCAAALLPERNVCFRQYAACSRSYRPQGYRQHTRCVDEAARSERMWARHPAW